MKIVTDWSDVTQFVLRIHTDAAHTEADEWSDEFDDGDEAAPGMIHDS